MIKYILNNNFTNKKNGNKSNTNELIISLINDEDLNQSFTNRKTVITLCYTDFTLTFEPFDTIPETFDFKEGDGEGAFVIRNVSIE